MTYGQQQQTRYQFVQSAENKWYWQSQDKEGNRQMSQQAYDSLDQCRTNAKAYGYAYYDPERRLAKVARLPAQYS
jgi:predicted RecB family nuclease